MQKDQSVVDVARRDREQKKSAARQSKVITNDDLDAGRRTSEVEGINTVTLVAPRQEEPNANEVVAGGANQVVTLAPTESRLKDKELQEVAVEDAEIAELKRQLAEARNELNWQQRQLALDQNTILSNPFYTATRAGKAKLDSEKLQIDEKRHEIQRIWDLLADREWRKWSRQKIGKPPDTSFDLPRENQH